ncbi:hypothetical protein GYMLUDRAFT_237733 [Collybiopsis luxurians FD-317 M1]|nr:hypothetical protein GYMLUDRAFT_237733 [Collybiopsis luxurians FD-317 M1]
MGRDEFSCLVLQELHRSNVWEEIHLATHPDQKVDRGSRLSVSPLKRLGHSLELPVQLIPSSKSEFKDWTLPLPFSRFTDSPSSRHILITASFGRIIPLKMLKLFAPERRLNVHPSLLPAYRGPAPIQHAILNGEEETGVCVINMLPRTQGIDAGPIWGKRTVDMPESAFYSDLRDKLAGEGGQLLVSVLQDMLDGKAVSVPQSDAAYAKPAPTITIEHAALNFTQMTAESIVRMHRAISHQRSLTALLHPISSVQIHSPSVYTSPLPPWAPTCPGRARYSKPDQALLIRCADNSVLSVPKVKQKGKALVDAGAWWNGVRGLGLVIDGEISFDSPEGFDLSSLAQSP